MIVGIAVPFRYLINAVAELVTSRHLQFYKGNPMLQPSLQEVTTTPAPGTASLSDIQDTQPITGTASLGDIASAPVPSVASMSDVATPAPVPASTPAPTPSIWDRVTRAVTESPLAHSLGAFFDPDTLRAEWEGVGPRLRNDPAYALRHAPIKSPDTWKALGLTSRACTRN
jgi:hypothetical protein